MEKEIIWNAKKTWKDKVKFMLFMASVGIAGIALSIALRNTIKFLMLQGYYQGCVDSFHIMYTEDSSVEQQIMARSRLIDWCAQKTEEQWSPPQTEAVDDSD